VARARERAPPLEAVVAFHIHQLHFILLDYLGAAVNEPFLRDMVNVPYYNGKTLVYPSVRL
jgi:hypothetical protein